ncbi:MAG: hypothetical protein ABIA63_04070, partial [bacterium]
MAFIIRDPVHMDIILNPEKDRLLIELINCEEMQRLRRIKQLGTNCIVFPGADHNRFIHSLGAMQVARQIMQHLRDMNAIDVNKYD